MYFLFQNTYVHLAAECLKKLRIRELYSFIELEKEILLPSSQSSSLRKRLLSSLLTDKSTEIDKFRLIALFGLHANELRSFSGGNEDREDDEGPLQRLLTEAIRYTLCAHNHIDAHNTLLSFACC